MNRILIAAVLFSLTSSSQAEITVDTDFPGGSGVVSKIDQNAGLITLDPDDHPGRGWRCWWYVKLTGLTPGYTVTLDVGAAPWATPDRATFSIDNGQTWQHTAKGTRDGKRILVAWGPPFVPADADALVKRLAGASPDAAAFSLCRTRENRDTPALRVTAAGNADDWEKRPLIWIQARQHAWESGASWVCRGFAEWLVSDDEDAVRLRKHTKIVIVPIMDIDNVHRGAGGKNQQPQDHNRDWSDTPHWRAVAAAQLEIRAAAEAGRLAAFIDLHNPTARDTQPYFYVPPKDILSEQGRKNLNNFLAAAKQHINGSLPYTGRTIESGSRYDPKWSFISKNWVAKLGTPAVAATLETAWNTPASTTGGYQAVGRTLGEALAFYISDRP
ncbi:MAG: M14 family zinc carboxypeptidase [Planctomycetota bacterium]|jgi:hypothetical protein